MKHFGWKKGGFCYYKKNHDIKRKDFLMRAAFCASLVILRSEKAGLNRVNCQMTKRKCSCEKKLATKN